MNCKVREIIDNAIIADMHSDIPMHVFLRRKNGERKVIENNYLTDIKAGGVNVILCVLFISEDELDNPLECGLEQLMAFREDIEESNDKISLCTSYEDVKSAIKQNKLALLIGFEGLEPIKSSKLLLKAFYDLGVRFSGMNWSRTNLVSDGCGYEEVEAEEKHGLTTFGREIVPYSESIGMITDVTHISEKGFWDTLNIIKNSCIASHTNAQGVHKIMRNFTDNQLIALKNKNSVVGITGVSQFVKDISNNVYPTVDDYINHIDYVKNLIGVDHIGIGLDLFSYFFNHELYSMPKEFSTIPPDVIANYHQIPVLVEHLIKKEYKDEEIYKILGGNFMNILKELL